MFQPKKIRNIAIIAHIDHGKTTLLDALLKQCGAFQGHEEVPERVMDSFDQERERGITIFAKHTAVFYNDFKVNIIDTPGHADFSGEVERILGMVNSVLLLVDAQDGPMPQTRFVLAKSLRMGLRPIVVLNKIDRPNADCDRVLNETFDLFVELGATDEQLDFPYCYASGLAGYAVRHLNDKRETLRPLMDLITEVVPAPTGSLEAPFLMQVATLGYNDFLGRQACGRILNGIVRKGDAVAVVDRNGDVKRHRLTRVEGYLGLNKVEMEEAGAGDIVSLSGMQEDVMIGDTLCHPEHIQQLPPISLEEPTVTVTIMVNSSPFAGREGKHVTMNKLRDRLERERKANISLKIEAKSEDAIEVSGRGELHLAVLIETMRREGYELTIGQPKVVVKEINGQKHEPIEKVNIEVPDQFTGLVIEAISRRKGEMQSLHTNEHGITNIEVDIPTRGLIGYRSEFLTATRGLGILTSRFDRFDLWRGDIPRRAQGVLISVNSGMITAYACFGLQDRGVLFCGPGQEVYEGMIVGEHNRDNDLGVNITRMKHLTNVRASGKDENLILIPPRQFTLEQAMEYIQDDECVEVTPSTIRMRKVVKPKK